MNEVTIHYGHKLPPADAMPQKKLQLARADTARLNRLELALAQLSVIYRREIAAALAGRKGVGSQS